VDCHRSTVAVALALFLLVAMAGRAQEAAYEGRTMGEWVEALDSDDVQSRISAAWVLSEIGPPAAEAVPSLLRALTDENAALRMLAAQALGAIGQATEAVIAALQAATNDADADVRETAAWALEQLEVVGPTPAGGGQTGTTSTSAVVPPGETTTPTSQPTTARYQPVWSEEEARRAVQAALLQSGSLGLLGEAGNQLNPNVGADAISLTSEDLSAHVALTASGSYRTIGDVVDFLAALGVRLSANGQAITVDDLQPDLQRYVTWCFAHRDDPRGGLGLALGSGPFLEAPQETPEISGETAISPIAGLMMVADLLVGVDQGALDASWGQVLPEPLPGGVRLAALSEGGPYLLAAGTGPATGALGKVRGFITGIELDPNFVDLMLGRAQLETMKRVLALFECQNRLTVRLSEPVGQTAIALGLVRAQWRGDAWWVQGARESAKTPTIPLVAYVGFMTASGNVIQMPFPRLHYTARLWASKPGPPDYEDSSMQMMILEALEGQTAFASAAGIRLSVFLTERVRGFRGDGYESPLVVAADAQLAERRPDGSLVPGGYRVESIGPRLPLSLTVSRVPGEAVPTKSPFGTAFIRVSAELGVADFFEFWLRYVEPMRVLGLTPAEDEALVRLATDKVLDISPVTYTIIFESKAEETSLATAELLGEYRLAPGNTPLWTTCMHLKVDGAGAVSGTCALQDNRETAQWVWLENLGQFSGHMKLDSQGRRQGAGGRDAQGRLDLGEFEATGTWRGVKQAPGVTDYTVTRGLTGAVRVRGHLLQGEHGQEAAGEIEFHGGDEWLRWEATASAWQEGLKQAQEFEREYGFKSAFPPWEHPDWLED